MAKISARGATATARWRKTNDATLVLCSDGRLLSKLSADHGYTVRHRNITAAGAALHATSLGYEKV